MALPTTGAQPIEEFIPGINTNGLYTNTAGNLLGSSNTINNPVFTGTRSGGVSSILNETTNAVLTATQSSSTILFNSTTGVRVTLPAPVIGLSYEFIVAQTPSAGTHGIQTNSSGTVFLQGALLMAPAAGTVATFTANGTSNFDIGMNGTTTGGIQGSEFRAVCVSATQWEIYGTVFGSGALATPIV